MRTSDTTPIIQEDFTNTYELWRKTGQELAGCKQQRRILEAENDYTK